MNTLAILIASVRRSWALPATLRAQLRQVSLRQVYFTGVEAAPLVMLLACAVGILVILQSADRLPDFGQAEFMGRLLVLVILRELAPVLVAFLVAARSGTAIAAELGTMGVRGEIDGMMGVGIDPLSYLVWPRVLGVVVANVALNLLFNAVAFCAGFGVATFYRPTLSLGALFDTLFRAMTLADLAVGGFKSVAMGIVIAGVCAARGLEARGTSTEVPRVTLRAVVGAFWGCLTVEMVVTLAFTDFGAFLS